MKSYAPKGLHAGMLRELMTDMASTPAQIAKLLQVTERTVWRWLSEDSAPYAVILALWHESPRGHYNRETDVGNHNAILRGLAASHEAAHQQAGKRLARLAAISDTGAANEPWLSGPALWSPPPGASLVGLAPLALNPGAQARQVAHDGRSDHGPGDHHQGLA
jgi:hypothetical protein